MTKKAQIADIERVDLVFLRSPAEPVSLDYGASVTCPEKHSRHLVPAPQAAAFVEAGLAVPVEEIRWTQSASPAQYLAKTPNGSEAQVARLLTAHPDLVPSAPKAKPAPTKPESGGSSEPSADSSAS